MCNRLTISSSSHAHYSPLAQHSGVETPTAKLLLRRITTNHFDHTECRWESASRLSTTMELGKASFTQRSYLNEAIEKLVKLRERAKNRERGLDGTIDLHEPA